MKELRRLLLSKSKPSLLPSLSLWVLGLFQLFINHRGLESLGGLLWANETSSRYFNEQFPFHLSSCFARLVKVQRYPDLGGRGTIILRQRWLSSWNMVWRPQEPNGLIWKVILWAEFKTNHTVVPRLQVRKINQLCTIFMDTGILGVRQAPDPSWILQVLPWK